MFKIFLRLHQVHIRGDLIFCVVDIAETIMIESGIVGLPWEPDGQHTDDLVNEDQNDDQASTYLR